MNVIPVILFVTISCTQSKRITFHNDDIENVFYYKDSLRKGSRPKTVKAQLRAPDPPPPPPPPPPAPTTRNNNNFCQPNCCIGLCCNGNNYNNNPNNYNDMEQLRSAPEDHFKPVMDEMMPLNFRRSALSKEHIKNLISHDEDIKKILRDLVKVTMQKINIMDIFQRAHALKQSVDNSSEE